jgi:SAM-dependent methyltransferase
MLSSDTENKAKSRPVCLWCDVETLTAFVCFDRRFGISGKREYRLCPNCACYSINPVPSQEELQKWYQQFYFPATKSTSVRQSSIARFWRQIDGQDCLESLLKPGSLLDIGCDTGDLLILAQKMGLDAWGQEFNSITAKFARNRGLKVIEAPLSSEKFPKSYFTNIVLSQVIEHVDAPLGLLREILPLLAPKGQIIISTPNPHGTLARLYKDSWAGWHAPFHLCMLSKRALRNIAKELGLVCTRSTTNTPSWWFFLSLNSYLYGKENCSNKFICQHTTWSNRLLILPILRFIDLLAMGDNTITLLKKPDN